MNRSRPSLANAGIVVALLLLVGAASCGDDTVQGSADQAPATASPTSSPSDDAEITESDPVDEADVPDVTASAGDGLFPNVVSVKAHRAGDQSLTFEVTLSSPYDSPERYADAWRVVGEDGTTYGVRELAHDHAGEQPFTRSLANVQIPDTVTTVTVEGRDQVNGWGGATLHLEVPPPG